MVSEGLDTRMWERYHAELTCMLWGSHNLLPLLRKTRDSN